jgi:hypothetical protein
MKKIRGDRCYAPVIFYEAKVPRGTRSRFLGFRVCASCRRG